MKEIRSEIEVEAPADRVWKILIDFKSYNDWNPFIYSASGEPVVGQKIQISLRTPSGRERKYEPTITKADWGQELRWVGKSTFLNGEHIFTIESQKPGLTRLVQREIFEGILSRFFGDKTDKDISAGFEQMNIALKRRAEHLGS